MVKLIFLCRRRPELTHEEYVERLLRGHVPLALRHHPSLRRYVVHVVEETLAGAPPLDSIGELWFDSLADYRERLYDSPAGERIIAKDVEGFLGSADAYATRECSSGRVRSLAGRSLPSETKLVVCLPAPADLLPSAFVGRWLEHEVPLLLERWGFEECVPSVVEQRLSPSAPNYAAIVELRFPTPAEDPQKILACVRSLGTGTRGYRVASYVQRC